MCAKISTHELMCSYFFKVSDDDSIWKGRINGFS